MMRWCSVLMIAFASSATGQALPTLPVNSHDITLIDGVWSLSVTDTDGPWQPTRVPGNLSFQGFDIDGVVRFQRSIALQEAPSEPWAIRLPMTTNAYELFINGALVGKRGIIGSDGSLVQKDFRNGVFAIPQEHLHAGDNIIMLRVRTFYGNGGVVAQGVLVGPEAVVRDAHLGRMLRVAALVALALFAALLHVVLYFGRREPHLLSFAGIAVCLATSMAGLNTLGYAITNSADVNAYLVFAPLIALPSLCVLFCRQLFLVSALRWQRFAVVIAGLSMTSLVASTAHNPWYPLFERFVMPVTIILVIVTYARAWLWVLAGVRVNVVGARPIIVGMTVYLFTGALELAWAASISPVYVDSSIGVATLIVTMAVALSLRVARLHSRAERGERDVLTGCLTRFGFDQRMRDAPMNSSSIIVLDIDHFKRINDTHGHAAGDDVLRATGLALQQALRGSDMVVRWGGEEFVMVLSGASTTVAADVAGRIRQAVQGMRMASQPTLRVTASLGVAQQVPTESIAQTIARADAALYEAKNTGRDRVVVAVAPTRVDAEPSSIA
jgi:diguanylate cyclase (GGDEF)-like protein